MIMKQEPPSIILLGLPFHDLTLKETLEECGEMMSRDDPSYLVTANVDFTTQANEDEDLRRIVFFADRVVCDGMPLVWLSRLFGYRLRERVAGSDMVPALLQQCATENQGVYFFGSDLQTLEEAKTIAEDRYPGLRVCGCDAPPMGAVVEWNNEEICNRMRASGARLLLVCLGCPKQERWIYSHYKDCGIPLSIGVGASLDFITGKQKRAPKWMQKTGMEWFWRMASNPRRLVARYSKDFLFLARAAFAEWRLSRCKDRLETGKRTSISASNSPEKELMPEVTQLWWSGSLEGGEGQNAEIPEVIEQPVLLDLSGVIFMDSSGLGRFAMLVRRCREAEKMLMVIAPSTFVQRAFKHAKFETLAPNFATHSDALRYLALGASPQEASVQAETTVAFHHELDAVHLAEMDATLNDVVENSKGTVVLDLADVNFIDSRAVGALVRTRKVLVATGRELFLSRPTPAVEKLIALLRLEHVLPVRKEAA